MWGSSSAQTYLGFSHNKALVLLLIVVVTCTILITKLEYVPGFSPFKTIQNYYKCNNSFNMTESEYRPRLGNEPKRLLYWTSFYGAQQNINRQLQCGPKGKQICHFTSDKTLVDSSHALIFHGWREDILSTRYYVDRTVKYEPKSLPPVRYPDQYWVLFMLESPHNYREQMRCFDPLFNWTWTYRTDSDIYMPYGKFQMLEKPIVLPNSSMVLPPGKNKMVLWVISNCRDVPSKRINLVKKLQDYIQVDVYGKCGTLKCPSKDCKGVLGKQYKFYLALENSLCQDYVTEKAFHAFANGMVPIVYGSANYDLFLPRGSFININSFPSAKSLAKYLLYLNVNDEEYVKYFKWKSYIELKEPGFNLDEAYCKLCEKVHHDYPLGLRKIVPNLTDWLFSNQEKKYRVCNEPLVW